MNENNCVIIKDATYELIIQFMLKSSTSYNRKILEDWIESRGNILDVLIEFLEAHNKVDYASPQEKDLLENYSCLTPIGKKAVEGFVYSLYSKECFERSNSKSQK